MKHLSSFFLSLLMLLPLTVAAQGIALRKAAPQKSIAGTLAVETPQTLELSYVPAAYYTPDETLADYYFLASSVPATVKSGEVKMSREGWLLYADLYAEPTDPARLPVGTYTSGDGTAAMTYDASYSYLEYRNAEGVIEATCLLSGDIAVSKDDDGRYIIDTKAVYAGKTFDVHFFATLSFADITTTPDNLPQIARDVRTTFTGALGIYLGNLYQSNTGNMLLNLYDGAYDTETGAQSGQGHCLQLCLYNKLFSDSKQATVVAGTYVMGRSFKRETWYPGIELEYNGMTGILGTFVQYVDAEGNYAYSYCADGKVEIAETDGKYSITVDLITKDGYVVTGTFEGNIPVMDQSDDQPDAHISTLTEDYELTLDQVAVSRIWHQDNTNGCGLFLADIGSPSGRDQSIVNNGGDIFRIAFLTAPNCTEVPEGVYTVMPNREASSFQPYCLDRGHFENGGDLTGTRWFHFKEGSYLVADGLAPAYDGTVAFSRNADNTVTYNIDVIDDAGFRITGVWSGPIEELEEGIAKVTLPGAAVSFMDNETIRINGAAATDAVQVFAADGTLIASGAGLRSVSLQGSPKGVYLVKVGKGQTIKLLKK